MRLDALNAIHTIDLNGKNKENNDFIIVASIRNPPETNWNSLHGMEPSIGEIICSTEIYCVSSAFFFLFVAFIWMRDTCSFQRIPIYILLLLIQVNCLIIAGFVCSKGTSL